MAEKITNWAAARFFKARKSEGGNGCVEVAFADGKIGVRDSKKGADSPVLEFTPHEWDAFLDGASKGEFNLPA